MRTLIPPEKHSFETKVAPQLKFDEIIGRSAALAKVFQSVKQVAPLNAPVLLLGESGTGKGMIARMIYHCSARKNKPMITVNCAALPENRIARELLGEEKEEGAGVDNRQIGRFEMAVGGTLFLDEIGNLSLELQRKLLRVIQDGELELLGSLRTIKTDVRIILATNRNLKKEIPNSKSRQDLYAQLNLFSITLPPLRERKEDIPLLVDHFLGQFNQKLGREVTTVPEATLKKLQEYPWPGNLWELESVIERAVIISQGSTLQVLNCFDEDRQTEGVVGQGVVALIDLERDYVFQVLQDAGWRIDGKNGAALLLGLNPSTLRARMRKLGIVRS
ncbi:sigma 54-interacting transcriptional regulator [Geopsychrobacter electrodiphilus]|uniref:sigma 54-interacting transcriptional regulator n=1 Tax=Geopsychrobacter electrodiphilus TaxID=225196 RepID=UPI0003714E5D|nr:sigma-54 dependent transcriptional regulator [Geopsychrobacter electrodiphilus]